MDGQLPHHERYSRYLAWGIVVALVGAPLGGIIYTFVPLFLIFPPTLAELGGLITVLVMVLILIPFEFLFSAPTGLIVLPLIRVTVPGQSATSFIALMAGALLSGFAWPCFLEHLMGNDHSVLMGVVGALTAAILTPWYFRATRDAAIKTMW